MPKPESPKRQPQAKAGLKPGETSNTDATRAQPRPVSEEDVFGGAERTQSNPRPKSTASKP